MTTEVAAIRAFLAWARDRELATPAHGMSAAGARQYWRQADRFQLLDALEHELLDAWLRERERQAEASASAGAGP